MTRKSRQGEGRRQSNTVGLGATNAEAPAAASAAQATFSPPDDFLRAYARDVDISSKKSGGMTETQIFNEFFNYMAEKGLAEVTITIYDPEAAENKQPDNPAKKAKK